MKTDDIFEILNELGNASFKNVSVADLNQVACSLSQNFPARRDVFEKLLSVCEDVSDPELQDLICAAIFSNLIEDPVDLMWISSLMTVIAQPGLSWVVAMSYKFNARDLHSHYCMANLRDEFGYPLGLRG